MPINAGDAERADYERAHVLGLAENKGYECITNVLNTMKFRPIFETPELNLIQMANFNFLKPQAKLTFTYNFGNRNVKTKTIKTSDESNRIKTSD